MHRFSVENICFAMSSCDSIGGLCRGSSVGFVLSGFLLPLAVSVVVVVFFSYHLVSIRWLLFLCDLALRYARRSDCTYGGSVIT